MSDRYAIEGAISSLANCMRLYVDAYYRFDSLFKIDAEEAINNIDRAFEMKLEGFYTLYDVSNKIFPYFEHGDATTIITVRNAIHHRNHPLFRSLNDHLHLQGTLARCGGASFLLASHPAANGTAIPMSHYFRLDDLDARIDPSVKSPHLDKSAKGNKATQRIETINNHLNLAAIRNRASQDRYPADQVYLDLMPIFISATCKVFRAMKAAGMGFKGFDAETYAAPFTSEIEVKLDKFNFKRLWLRGFGPLDLIPIPL